MAIEKEAAGRKKNSKERKIQKKLLDSEPKKPPSSKNRRQPRKQRKPRAESDNEDDELWPCLICGETYSRSREKWIQCQSCKHWAHEDCTDGRDYFLCQNCDSDDDI